MKAMMLVAIMFVVAGCVQADDVYVNDASNEQKVEPEYAIGLSELMQLPSPSMYATNFVVRFYNLGYTTGQVECGDGVVQGDKFARGLAVATMKGAEAGGTDASHAETAAQTLLLVWY